MQCIKSSVLLKCLFVVLMFSSTGVLAEKTRSNELILEFLDMKYPFLAHVNIVELLNVTFTVKDHVETQPLTFEGVSAQTLYGNKAKITIKVGRKGSSSVADTFNTWVLDPFHNMFNHTPDKLNFSIKGDLAFTLRRLGDRKAKTYVYHDFVIAQGHTDTSRNNWWAGSPHCYHGFFGNYEPIPGRFFYGIDGKVMTCGGSGSVHMSFFRKDKQNVLYILPENYDAPN